MSSKKGGKSKKHLLLAKLVTGSNNSVPCAFCNRDVDDEIIYGKLYAIGDIQCHYFCVLLSCCLVQKGKDEEGLFGFLYPDIIAEIDRSKKHKCSYCGRDGATLGCSVSQCRKQFHLPCGRERNAVSLFYGNFKSFCERHAPKQRVNDEIMAKARPRKASSRKLKMLKRSEANKDTMDVSDSGIENSSCNENAENMQCNTSCQDTLSNEGEQKQEAEVVCVICYENVEGFPTLNTFWPPCCARDAWFHRSCLQRMALSAGMHYLKCPLCNRKEAFYEAVLSQGYYVPDRDASWELEQNAFAEIYERPVTCSALECSCPLGRDYDTETGSWDIRLCVLCGSTGIHLQCAMASTSDEDGGNRNKMENFRHVCPTCAPAAPEDLDKLVIDTATVPSPVAPTTRGQPMPSRMSLRRTKQRALRNLSASASDSRQGLAPVKVERESQESSRLELDLKAPEKPLNRLIEPTLLRNVENKLLSPLKLLEQGLLERIPETEDIKFDIDSDKLIDQMRERFTKPKPLVEKKKIVNELLESVLESLQKDKTKTKEPLKEWHSPKKCVEVKMEPNEEKPQYNKEDCNNPPTIKEENEHVEVCDICYNSPNILEANEIEDRKDIKTIVPETKIEINEEKHESDSSNSTFQLPSEFVAEDSNDSLPHFESPKKRPVFVNSSMEISHENNVNIDLVTQDHSTPIKMQKRTPTKNDKSPNKVFKLSPPGVLTDELEIDEESFKCRYLNEVDRDYKGNNANIERVVKRKSENEVKKHDGEAKRRRKINVLSKKDIRVKVRWPNPLKKSMLRYSDSPNERRLIQTSIQSFFGAKLC